MSDTSPEINKVIDSLTEAGYRPPEPDQGGGSLPPGKGVWTFPHHQSFSAIFNNLSRTYRWTYDEALRHSRTNALACWRDPVIREALNSRQLPTAQLAWHLEARDDTDQAQVEAAKGLTEIIEEIPRRQQLFKYLLHAVWFGRYGAQLIPSWDYSTGQKRMVIRDHRPINGDKFVFKYGGRPGILVNHEFPGDWEPTDQGRAHFFTPSEREQLIIHTHEPEDADFREGEMAGGVHGVGLRHQVYWLWFIKHQVLSWMLEYLERVGAGGFTIYYYLAGDPASLTEVKEAAESNARGNEILFPRMRDTKEGGPGVDRVEPGTAGAALLENLITNYFDATIRRCILGQELTSETAPTGLGSGVADLHADTFIRIVKFDAVNLEETIQSDLIKPLSKYNYPGVPVPRFKFDVDKPNAAEVLESSKAFWEMGGTLDEDELRGVLGLAKPKPGAAFLSQMPPNPSPAGFGVLPQGVPMAGQPGPVPLNQPGNPPPPGPEGVGPPVQMARRGPRIKKAKTVTPHPQVGKHATEYANRVGLNYVPGPQEHATVDLERAKRIADHYEAARHAPTDPEVVKAYDRFKAETKHQYEHLINSGVQFEPWSRDGQPYQSSKEMRDDVHRNNHLYYFLGGDFPDDHPMKEPSGHSHNGRPLSYNDLFRAVHDYYGHSLYGNEFGPQGEEHAWLTHSRMYSPEARPAMSWETRGQNSWVNFGPHIRREDGSIPKKGDPDWVHPGDRPYADQKANVLPRQWSDPDYGVQLSRHGPKVKKGQPKDWSKRPKPRFVRHAPNPEDVQKAEVEIEQLHQGEWNLPHTWVNPDSDPDVNRGRQFVADLEQDPDIARGASILPQITPDRMEVPDRLSHNALDHLTPGERASLNQKGVNAFLDVFGRIPPTTYFQEAAKAGMLKRGWYKRAVAAIKELLPHGHDSKRFAALLAATSPRVSVSKNLRLALDIWGMWHRAGRPTNHDEVTGLIQEAAKRKLTGELDEAGRPIPWAKAMAGHLPNAYRALTHPEEQGFDNFRLSGPKVDSFYRNLSGDLKESTNDVWMARFANIPHSLLSGKADPNASPDETTFGGMSKKSPAYLAMTAKVRQTAHELNQNLPEGEEPWEPAEVQETIWSFVRSLVNLQRHRKLDALTALSSLTHGHIAETTDFATLVLNDPAIERRIRNAGLGEGFDRLRSLHSDAPSLSEATATGRVAPTPSDILRRIALYSAFEGSPLTPGTAFHPPVTPGGAAPAPQGRKRRSPNSGRSPGTSSAS